MRAIEASRWDDIALVVLLLVIGVPRAVLALLYEHPIEAEGVLAMVSVGLALFILIRRNDVRSRGNASVDLALGRRHVALGPWLANADSRRSAA